MKKSTWSSKTNSQRGTSSCSGHALASLGEPRSCLASKESFGEKKKNSTNINENDKTSIIFRNQRDREALIDKTMTGDTN